MTAHYGAHEVMEMHEILDACITDINTMQLYRTYAKDQQLSAMMDKHLQFAVQSYNSLVQMVNQAGMAQAVPYRAPKMAAPTYGLHQPGPVSPNTSAGEVDDRDISGALLQIHKNGAVKKMMASLECADVQLRRTLQQGAVNCGEQAYEVWQYMNQRGYYQVPTMKEMTTNTMMNMYQPVAATPGMTGTQTATFQPSAAVPQPTLTSSLEATPTAGNALPPTGTKAVNPTSAQVMGMPYDPEQTAYRNQVSPAALVYQGTISPQAMASLQEFQNPYTSGQQPYHAAPPSLSSHAAHGTENQNAAKNDLRNL